MVSMLFVIGIVWGCVVSPSFRKTIIALAIVGTVVMWVATGYILAGPALFFVMLLPS
jgi:hypothetical protein